MLQTSALSIGYDPDFPLQQDIDLALAKGEIVSLMGQNGVGKTTFIKTLNGLLKPLAGEVLVDGKNIKTLSRHTLARKFSVVLTDKPGVGNLSVNELIALGRHPHNHWLGILSLQDKKSVERAIDLCKINYLADRQIRELSDGQLQKVMIARALAQETDIIVLDEPVAHLDLNNKIEVLLLLREIANQGKAVLISTHDLQLTSQLSDRLWLFNFNAPIQSGLPEDLIVSGKLEKALYLSEHPFDLVHQRLNWPPKGPSVVLEGNEEVVFWTEQALNRSGFRKSDEGPVVNCNSGEWRCGTLVFETIETLVQHLKLKSSI